MPGTRVRSNPPRPPPAVAAAAGLAHDASNLLAGLGLYCDLLERPGVLQAAHAHYAVELRLLSHRSSGLIRRLIDQLNPEPLGLWPDVIGPPAHRSGSARSGDVSADPAPDLAASLHKIAPLLAALAAPCARLVLSAPRALPSHGVRKYQVSFETLERIVINLVTNAAQAIAASATPCGCIWVTLRLAGSAVDLEVADNGPGMAPSAAAAFLHPRRMAGGERRGFGHRILQELVHATGAQLTLRKRPAGGTAINVVWSHRSLRAPAPPALALNRKKEAAQPC